MANIKELSEKIPERLGPGHRLCAGCGASIAVRQILMGTEAPVVAVCATGCLEVATTIYPFTAWRTPFMHNAFENSAATISGIETAYRALKKKGKINKEIKFLALGGDGGTYDIGLQALSGALERGHNFVYCCYNNEAYMNCLSLSSLIATEDGIKKITEIKVGEQVYAFDMKTHQLVLKRCSGVFDNGIKDVYELSTLHHSIKATSNHPFLVLERNGRGKSNELIWKQLKDISPGDEIVVSKQLVPGKSVKFNFEKARKDDCKVNKINEVKIPRASSSELMKYLGICVGNGWTGVNKAEVGFALPENSEERRFLFILHRRIFGNSLSSDRSYAYVHSINVARFIESLGFGLGAKNRKVPSRVFSLPNEEKEAFVQEPMLSDGYQIGNSMRYVSTSPQLLETLRLLQNMDYRVGKIHYKNQNFLIGNEYFAMEKVKQIKWVGKEPTLDLRVEGEHNFIANGIVVHNTGIQRSGATPKGASTTTAPAGKVIPGKPQIRKDLTAIVAAHRIPYVAQGTISHWNDLITKAQKAFAVEGPAFLNVLSMCHRGWRHPPEDTVKIARLAVETGFWPLIEVENGIWRFTFKPKERKPIEEFLKPQGRFKHLFTEQNRHIIAELQKEIDENWARLEHLCEASCKVA